MSPEFARSAALITEVMPPAADWWIIGSAALALSGIDLDPRDIDVFAASEVIEAVRLRLGAVARPSASDRFRSTPYFQVTPEGGLEIDFMGGLEVRPAGEWVHLQVESRVRVAVDGVTLFVPSLTEQARILHLFGRPKDLVRAALITGRSPG